jgi:hypothetical protein
VQTTAAKKRDVMTNNTRDCGVNGEVSLRVMMMVNTSDCGDGEAASRRDTMTIIRRI